MCGNNYFNTIAKLEINLKKNKTFMLMYLFVGRRLQRLDDTNVTLAFENA
jgi:hypothetical protein